MSQTTSIVPVNVVQVVDPRIDLDNQRVFVIKKSALNTDTTVRYASGNSSISQVIFNVVNPNVGVAIGRTIYVDITFDVAFTGTCPVGSNLLDGLGNSLAPRDLPLSRSIRVTQARINNSSVSVQTSQITNAMRYYHMGKDSIKHEMSMCPFYSDQDQNYRGNLLNTIRNPLGTYGNGHDDSEPRGGFPGMTIISNTPTNGVIRLRTIEPLFLPPLTWVGEHSALYHVQTLDVTLILDSNIGNLLFSGVNDTTGLTYSHFTQAPTVTISGTPQLLLNFMKIPDLMSVPDSISYPYSDIQVYTQDIQQSIAPSTAFTVNINSIQLGTVPQRMYVFAKRRDQDMTLSSTDTYARLESVQVTLGANNVTLNSATPQQLYQISRRNGLTMSYNEYYGSTGTNYPAGSNRQYNGIGSVFCAEFGSDIGLNDELLTSGQLKVDTLQMRASFTNLNPTDSIDFIVYVIIVNPGIFTLTRNLKAYQELGVITRTNVLDSRNSPKMDWHAAMSLEGGDFFGNVKSFFSKIPSYLAKAKPFISAALPIFESTGIPALSTVAKVGHLLGYGCGGEGLVGGCQGCEDCACGEGIVGGKMRRNKTRGGKLISRHDL